jgi:hypothetical protein
VEEGVMAVADGEVLGTFRARYPGGPDRFEYRIPQAHIGRFNELTRRRVAVPFKSD